MRAARGSRAPSPERILPDGCIEIIFNLADRFRFFDDTGVVETRPAQLVVGPTTRSVRVQPAGAVDLVGIRLRPAGARALLRTPPAELRDRAEPLDRVETTMPRDLGSRLRAARSGFERRRNLADGLTPLADAGAVDERVKQACRMIESTAGRAQIDPLAQRCGVSARSLERLFERYVGVPPKLLARMTRFHQVLRGSGPRSGLLDAALDGGYYDQPHFLRDFRDFAGVSPTRFFEEETNRMSEAFTSAE